MRALKNGEGDSSWITKVQVDGLSDRLQYFADHGSPELRSDILNEMSRLNLPEFVGMTMAEAWIHLHAIWGEPNPPPVSEFAYKGSSDPFVLYSSRENAQGGEFSEYWAVFRDPDDGYGFAYPADWILRTTAVAPDVDSYLWLCNSDIDYWNDEPKGICILLVEDRQIDPEFTLEQAARVSFCPYPYDLNRDACLIAIIPEKGAHPARAEVNHTPLPQMEFKGVIFQNSSGKAISLAASIPIMSTPEILALIDSIVLGVDTPILAPSFRPSGRGEVK
jgi:hypothetical protein